MKKLALLSFITLAPAAHANGISFVPVRAPIKVSPIITHQPVTGSTSSSTPVPPPPAPASFSIDLNSGSLACTYSGELDGDKPAAVENFTVEFLSPNSDDNSISIDLSGTPFNQVQTTAEKREAKVIASCKAGPDGPLKTTAHLPFFGRLTGVEVNFGFVNMFTNTNLAYPKDNDGKMLAEAGAQFTANGQTAVGSIVDTFGKTLQVPQTSDIADIDTSHGLNYQADNLIKTNPEGKSACGTDIAIQIDKLELFAQKNLQSQLSGGVFVQVPTVRFKFEAVTPNDTICAK